MEFRWRRVVFRRADLDTCGTAFLAGIRRDSHPPMTYVRGNAAPADLGNPKVLCIGCGGTGFVRLSNFDDHFEKVERAQDHHSATEQFFDAEISFFEKSEDLRRLVKYIDIMDTKGPAALPRVPRDCTSLITIVAGLYYLMRPRSAQEQIEELFSGIDILADLVRLRINPFQIPLAASSLPAIWHDYLAANAAQKERIRDLVLDEAIVARTNQGKVIAYLDSQGRDLKGCLSFAQRQGMDLFVLREAAPAMTPKFIICSSESLQDVDEFFAALAALGEERKRWYQETKGYVIGFSSRMTLEALVELVKQYF